LFYHSVRKMASSGQIVFEQIVSRLGQKIQRKFITGHDTRRIGLFFWNKINCDCKQIWRDEHGLNAFWAFAQALKNSFLTDNRVEIIKLYNS